MVLMPRSCEAGRAVVLSRCILLLVGARSNAVHVPHNPLDMTLFQHPEFIRTWHHAACRTTVFRSAYLVVVPSDQQIASPKVVFGAPCACKLLLGCDDSHSSCGYRTPTNQRQQCTLWRMSQYHGLRQYIPVCNWSFSRGVSLVECISRMCLLCKD